MTAQVQAPSARRRVPTETWQRRWRLALLLGLVALVALAGLMVLTSGQGSDASRMASVLVATRDIHAGTTITGDELGTTRIRPEDPKLLSTLVKASGQPDLVGQIAVVDVPSGGLVPANAGIPRTSARLWDVPLPARRMPADLRAGDHVAVVVTGASPSGQQVDFVYVQDVPVLSVQSGSADLWLPGRQASPLELLADHGGIVLVKMQPGTTQPELSPGGGS